MKGDFGLPCRKKLPHDVPSWVSDGSVFFLTVACKKRGINSLCREDMAAALVESLRFRMQNGIWWISLFLLMPDHCHGLIGFSRSVSLRLSVKDWKRFLAREAGLSWQRDFFDHRIRDDRSFRAKELYICENPVRAGLCEKPEDWPYLWRAEDLMGKPEGRALSLKEPRAV